MLLLSLYLFNLYVEEETFLDIYMLSRHEPYHELGADYFDERKKTSVINHLLKRLEKLGFSVAIEPVTTPALSS
jgi:hypothetical protein